MISEGWGVIQIQLPTGEVVSVATKGDCIRIRSPEWVPLEVIPSKVEVGVIIPIISIC